MIQKRPLLAQTWWFYFDRKGIIVYCNFIWWKPKVKLFGYFHFWLSWKKLIWSWSMNLLKRKFIQTLSMKARHITCNSWLWFASSSFLFFACLNPGIILHSRSLISFIEKTSKLDIFCLEKFVPKPLGTTNTITAIEGFSLTPVRMSSLLKRSMRPAELIGWFKFRVIWNKISFPLVRMYESIEGWVQINARSFWKAQLLRASHWRQAKQREQKILICWAGPDRVAKKGQKTWALRLDRFHFFTSTYKGPVFLARVANRYLRASKCFTMYASIPLLAHNLTRAPIAGPFFNPIIQQLIPK